MTDFAALHFTSDPCEGPCFYQFSLNVPSSPAGANLADTFLNTHVLSKDILFLNAHPLQPLLVSRTAILALYAWAVAPFRP